MKFSAAKRSWLLLGAASLAGCDVAYEIGPRLDAQPAQVDGGATQSLPMKDAQPGTEVPSVSIKGIPFPCDRWGKGAALKDPSSELDSAVRSLWLGDASDLAEARGTYRDVLAKGRTGDVFCVALHMLENVRAVRGVGAFYDKWLSLREAPEKDPTAFPKHTAARLELMARDARDFAVDATLRGSDNWRRLFTTQRTLTLPPDWRGPAPDAAALSAGILTEPGVLATRGTRRSAATARGAWARETFFCEQVPAPPADIEPVPEDVLQRDMSYRDVLAAATSPSSCQGCHQLLDPIGLALDPFDVVGQTRQADDRGKPFVTGGVLKDENQSFENTADLGRVIAEIDAVRACYAQNWFAYVSGAARGEELAAPSAAIANRFGRDGTMKTMIAAVFEALAQR